MIEIVIKYIEATFKNSMPEITNVNGLAEKINEDGKEYPAIYCGKDELKNITGEDNYLYFRQNGTASEEESEEESVSGCDSYVKRTYPMLAVAYVPKSIYNTDNAYIDGKVANNIANIIRDANYQSLNATLTSDNIYTDITAIETNRNNVWKGEYSNIEMAARHDHVLCSIEFDIVIEATESCFKNFDCNDEEIVVSGDTITVLVSDPLAWHRDGDTVTGTNKKLGSTNAIDWNIIQGGAIVATVKAAGIDIIGNLGVTGDGLTLGNQLIGGNLIVTGSITYGSGAIQSLNGLTDKVQTLVTGTTGTDFGISSSGTTHTFNIPDASATARGLVTIGAQTFGGTKTFSSVVVSGNLLAGTSTALARLTIVGSGIGTGWTAQFHNSTGISNSVMIRDNGFTAFGNADPQQRVHVSGDLLIGDYGASLNLLRFANVSSVSNSAFIGRTAAAEFEINPGSVNSFRVQIPTGANTIPLLFQGSGFAAHQWFRDGRQIKTILRTATANNDYGWSFTGTLTARATANGGAGDTLSGTYLTPTLVAAANNQRLVSHRIAGTYTNGAFTGVANIALELGNNLLLGRLTADPTTAENGMMYYNTTLNKFRGYEAGAWANLI